MLSDALGHDGSINVGTKMLDIAHESYPGENPVKRYVRSRVWFPKMDKDISKITQGCLACQAFYSDENQKSSYTFLSS